MRELLFRFYPKSNFGQYHLTVSRYHLLFLLKFILWLIIGILTGSGLSYIYTHYQYEPLSMSPCVPTYWLHAHKHQQHGDLVKRHLVKILVIHISEESQLILKLKHQIWRQQAGSKSPTLNHVLHFVDQDLYQDGEVNRHNDQEWLVTLKGLSNATFMQGFKMIIYHLLTSSDLTHEFYCFTINNVQLDHRRLQRLLNSVYFRQPLSVKKRNKKEQIQNPGCLLASNCTPADGLILSRSVLENASAIIRACMLSDDFGTFLNFKSRFNECITSTLFECVESPKVHRIFRSGYKCESVNQQFANPEEVEYQISKTSHFPHDILATEKQDLELLQQRLARLSLESSAVTNMIDFIQHNRSLVTHQIHAFRQWLTSQTLPQNLPHPDSLETSPWHYTNDRYIYTTHNLHKSPTQKLIVRNSSWLLDTTQNTLLSTWKMFDQYITGLRFRYSYQHVHPVLGARHLWRIGATLHPKYPKIKPRLCNVTFYTCQKYHWPPLSKIEEPSIQHGKVNKHISLIVPVAGRQEAFVRFLKMLKRVFLVETNLDVIFIVFRTGPVQQTSSIVESLRNKHPNIKIQVIIQQELFARAKALQIGVSHTREGVILLFVDVDMIFTNSFLNRVRLNTILGRQAYFPIYFSQYNSAPKCDFQRNCSLFRFQPTDGLWRYFGFGMVSIYKQDFIQIGGYDLTIKGWGQEDIRFYETSLQNLIVFRAPDPGLVHIYHNKSCSFTLTPLQYEMCLGSKFNIFNHQWILANFTYINHHILNRSVG